jgi:hypothetical protein
MRREIRPQHDLAALATHQRGVVAASQLRDLGYSEGAIRRAAAAGRLFQVHRGVYAVGHNCLSDHARCLASTLACGHAAMASHQSAAWLWGIAPTLPARIDVTMPARGHRREAIRIHHSTILEEDDRALVDGIPLTAVPRTLLDLASNQSQRRLVSAIDRCERLGLLDVPKIDALIERSGRHRGRRGLGRALDIYRDPVFSRARSERLFRALVECAGLPLPAINTFVAGHEIDAYWEVERFAVEIDGWDAHRTRASFESDRRRQEDLKLAGIDSIRITARRVEKEPSEIGSRLGRLLEQRRSELRTNPTN